MKKRMTSVWLLLSSFGIMFAVLSWIQESVDLDCLISYKKGVVALITGILLYHFLAKKTVE